MSVIPAKHNLKGWKGGTFRKQFTLYTGASDTSPTRDLTDYTGRCLIRDPKTDATLIDLTTDNGGVILGDAEGTVELFITDEDTLATTWSNGKYVLSITDTVGDTEPLLHGGFTLGGP